MLYTYKSDLKTTRAGDTKLGMKATSKPINLKI